MSALFGAAPVWAQEGNPGATGSSLSIESITVTARKREENLQSVPLAISAYSGDMLEQRGATNIDEAARFSPNVSIGFANSGSGSSASSEIYIRGIGQQDFLITEDPGVGIYIDEVYLSRTNGTMLDFLDVERVEILRGPQGTIFGRNTIGGAISLHSKKPADEYGGEIQLTAGRYNKYAVKASVDLPLSDELKSRHTFYYNTEDGYTKRDIGDRLGDEEVSALRSQFQWDASDAFNAALNIDYSKKEGTSANNAVLVYDAAGVAGGLAPLWQALVGDPASIAAPATVNGDTPFQSGGTAPAVDDLEAWGVSAILNWDLDAFSVKSITAYRELDAEFARDGDNTAVTYIQTHNFVEQQQLSQEFQFSGRTFGDRLDWLFGAYYFQEDATDENFVRLAGGLFDALEGLPAAVIYLGGPDTTCATFGIDPDVICAGGAGNPVNIALDLDFDVYNEISTEGYALFTHNTFDLTDRVSVSAGLRWAYEEKEYFLEHLRANAGVPIIPATTVGDDWSEFLPKFSVDFQATDQVFAYASASRGFKSGGFNGRPTTEAEVQSFDPEFVWAYEAGLKTQLLDDRLVLNVSGFYYDYEDIQISIVSADDFGNLVLIVENAAKATVSGIEAEFQALPTDYIAIDGAIGYLDAQYDELEPGAPIAESNDLVKTPDITANLGVSLIVPLDADWEGRIRADWSYRGDHFNDVPNTPELEQEAISLVNARLSLTSDALGWDFSVYGTNLTDEEYISSGISALGSFGTIEGVFAPPRMWGASIRKTF